MKKVKSETAVQVWLFEHVLAKSWFCKREEERRFKALIDAGYLTRGPKEVIKYEGGEYAKYNYTPTKDGIHWWATERNKKSSGDPKLLATVPGRDDQCLDWKGIGGTFSAWFSPHIDAQIAGIRDGLFEFVWYSGGHPGLWRMGEQLGVALTPKGYEYYSVMNRQRCAEAA
ncbi:MAG: hypothetical protein A2Z18_11065 [Armatimonadetes bacterium RBG_16_58_9]|nr:MAG: hypothetical protein A2Z18_11065 [Armatimonadetes bacterium RBG_16_58_9]